MKIRLSCQVPSFIKYFTKYDNSIIKFMRLSKINVYPIKSLGGVSLTHSIVEKRGLQFDRRWMLIDETGKFLTQREFPKMATINVEILPNDLRVLNSSSEKIIPFEPLIKNTISVKIWSSRFRASVYGADINEYFSGELGTKCRLVLMPPEATRKVSYFYAVHNDDAVSFADAYPFLLTGENSLADLNEKLENPVPMNRFRPNFVISGSDAFAEDSWKQIKIGAAVFHVVKPCARCVITTIDQETGTKQGVEPLKTLSNYRIPKRSVKKKILFGQYLIAENVGAEIRAGDLIEILETKS